MSEPTKTVWDICWSDGQQMFDLESMETVCRWLILIKRRCPIMIAPREVPCVPKPGRTAAELFGRRSK